MLEVPNHAVYVKCNVVQNLLKINYFNQYFSRLILHILRSGGTYDIIIPIQFNVLRLSKLMVL